MAAPSADQVEEALQLVSLTSANRKAAVRCLNKWAEKDPDIQVDEDTIKLYLALHSILSATNNKVTPIILKTATREVVSSTAWVQTVNVLPKIRKPNLDTLSWYNTELQQREQVKDYILDPKYFTKLPPACNPDEHWFTDILVPLSVLGPGSSEIVVSISDKMKIQVPDRQSAIHAPPPLEGDGCSEKPSASSAEVGLAAEAHKETGLKAVPSDPDKLLPWPDRIGKKTVQLVKEDKWTSEVDGDPNCVLCQFELYVEHVELEVKSNPNVKLGLHVTRYMEYLTSNLMAKDTYVVVARFLPLYLRIKEARAEMHGRYVPGFEEVHSWRPSDRGFPLMKSLSPEDRTRFTQSPYFEGFMVKQILARVAYLQKLRQEHAEANKVRAVVPGGKISDDEISSEMKAFLAAGPPASLKPMLQFAATWLGSEKSTAQKFVLLMSSVGHFEMLRAWSPGHCFLEYQIYVEDEFRASSQQLFLRQCRLLSKAEGVVKLVKHDVVRSLIGNLASLEACASTLSDEDPKEGFKVLVGELFIELSVKKLGADVLGSPLDPVTDIRETQYPRLLSNEDLVKSLHKSIIGSFRKYGLENATSQPASNALRASVTKMIASEEGGSQPCPAQVPSVGIPPAGAPPAGKPSEGSEPGHADETQASALVELKEGMFVRTRSGTKALNEKKGEICKIGRRVKVKMLEGPQAEQTKEFARKKLVPWTDILPAGQKRKGESSGEEGGSSKTAKSDAQRADDIFGPHQG